MLVMLEGLCYFQTSSFMTTSAAGEEIKNWGTALSKHSIFERTWGAKHQEELCKHLRVSHYVPHHPHWTAPGLRKTRGMFGCWHAFPFDHHAEWYFLIHCYLSGDICLLSCLKFISLGPGADWIISSAWGSESITARAAVLQWQGWDCQSQMEREGSLPVLKHICIVSDIPKSSCNTPLLLISPLTTDFCYFPFIRFKNKINITHISLTSFCAL